jgi:hypothetical protein
VIQSLANVARQSTVLVRVTRAVVLGNVLLLAGCSRVDWAYYKVTDAVESAFSETRHTSSARPAPSPASSPWRSASTSTSETKPVMPTTTQPEATPVVVDGLSGKAVRTLLGQPAARSGPAPGETWTYKSGSCQVDLYLFPDVKHGDMQVLDHRVNGAGSHEDNQACLRRLRDDQRS